MLKKIIYIFVAFLAGFTLSDILRFGDTSVNVTESPIVKNDNSPIQKSEPLINNLQVAAGNGFLNKKLSEYSLNSDYMTETSWNSFIDRIKLDAVFELEKELGSSILSMYIKAGLLDNETQILEKLSHSMNIPDKNGKTPVAYAAESGDLNALRLLLDNGADPFYSFKDPTTGKETDLMNLALRSGKESSVDIILTLLDEGLSFQNGNRYLTDAISNEIGSAFLPKIAKNTDPNAKINDKPDAKTNIVYTISSQHGSIVVDKFLREGTKLSSNALEFNSLHASGHNSFITPETYQKLIDAGANINAVVPKTEMTPIMHAINGGRVDFVEILLQNGADVTRKDWRGRTVYDYVQEKLNKTQDTYERKKFEDIHTMLEQYNKR